MPQQQNEFTENNSAAPAQGVEDTVEETPIIKKTDYELGVVPAGERKGWLPIAGIWIAIGIDLSGTILGVQLGAGMPFGQAIFATMLGSLLLGLFAMAATYVGAATGFTSAMISRTVFGRAGGFVIALAMAISSLGWFGVQTGFFATNAQVAVFELWGLDWNIHVFTVLGGILMAITALWGYRSIERLSSWAVPLLIVLLFVAVIMAFVRFGTGNILEPVDQAFSLGGAVSLVVGIFVFGVIVSPDIARWAKTPKQAMAAGFVGFFIGNSLIVLVALVLSQVMGTDDFMQMFFILGIGAIAIVVLTLAQWTTNTNNLYSATLSLSVVIPKMGRKTLTVIGAVIAIAAAVLGIYDHFIPFISAMSAIIAPYGGVFMADFFMRRGTRLKQKDPHPPRVDYIAFISWAVGAVVGVSTTQPGDGLGFGLFSISTIPALDAVLAAFVVHALLCLITRTKAAKTAS